MRIRQPIFASLLMVLSALPGISATLGVNASATPDAGLYDYSYAFSITGAGANVDNIFLGSNDLSPLNVVVKLNGSSTSNWSWLGNDTPQNYLQFFSTNGSALGNGDVLDVTFSSVFTPGSAFALGEDGSTSAVTNTVTGVLSPTTGVPEPAALPLVLSGMALVCFAGRRCAVWFRR